MGTKATGWIVRKSDHLQQCENGVLPIINEISIGYIGPITVMKHCDFL